MQRGRVERAGLADEGAYIVCLEGGLDGGLVVCGVGEGVGRWRCGLGGLAAGEGVPDTHCDYDTVGRRRINSHSEMKDGVDGEEADGDDERS